MAAMEVCGVAFERTPEADPLFQQQIADAATDEICDVIELTETRQHFQRVGIDQRA